MPSIARNIIVTGGARGLGRCITRHLLNESASHRVYLLDIMRDELTYTATNHLKSFYDSKRLGYSVIDLSDAKAVRSAIKEAATEFFPDNRIDVLVNNAGLAAPGWSEGKTLEDESTLDEWNKYLATNLTGPYLASQAVIPYMKQPPQESSTSNSNIGSDTPIGGCIINMSSFRAHFSDLDSEPYGATKAGLLGLTHSMAVSCQRWNIRVNAVLPGFMSAIHECRDGDEGKIGSWEERHPTHDKTHLSHLVNRVGKAEDIAEAISYLIGAGFVTGQELIVDGGLSIMKERDNV